MVWWFNKESKLFWKQKILCGTLIQFLGVEMYKILTLPKCYSVKKLMLCMWTVIHAVTDLENIDLSCGSSSVSVQSLSYVRLLATPWTAALQASLSITISWSLLKLMSIETVMISNHLILYRPLLLLPSIFPSIRIFSNESVLHIRWPK